MSKQAKQMLILILVLALLAAAFFGLKYYNQEQSEKEAEGTAETVVDIDKEDVIKLTYDYEGETYTLEKVDGTWYYAEDNSQPIMQYLVNNMVSMVAPLKAEQIIEDVTDMSQYGLAEAARTISFETENASYIFETGSYNAVSGVYYICKPSDTTVYAVESTVVTIFDKTLEDLLDPVETSTEEAETSETDEAEGSIEEAETSETDEAEESIEEAETSAADGAGA